MTTTTTTAATPVAPSHGILRPLGLDDVRITGGFWAERQAVNGSASLAHIEHWMEREGWIGNFDTAAAGTLSDLDRGGREFSDSEVYKLLEAMAWEIGRTDDAALDGRFRALVGRVAAAVSKLPIQPSRSIQCSMCARLASAFTCWRCAQKPPVICTSASPRGRRVPCEGATGVEAEPAVVVVVVIVIP